MSKAATYALNVITLAAWLSVALGAFIGLTVSQDWSVAFAVKPPRLQVMSTVDIAPADPAVENANESAAEEAPSDSELIPVTAVVPSPPPMPDIAPMSELPEIPEMPAPVIKKTATQVAKPAAAKPSTSSSNANRSSSDRSSNGAANGNSPPSKATTLSFGSGAGRQPAPSYPLQARRTNQQGTVVVEFIVGADGKVLSAWVKTACPYPLLNDSALSTVRSRWKFPAGPARRYRVPIIFRLN